jgi:hypothetical protein
MSRRISRMEVRERNMEQNEKERKKGRKEMEVF